MLKIQLIWDFGGFRNIGFETTDFEVTQLNRLNVYAKHKNIESVTLKVKKLGEPAFTRSGSDGVCTNTGVYVFILNPTESDIKTAQLRLIDECRKEYDSRIAAFLSINLPQ